MSRPTPREAAGAATALAAMAALLVWAALRGDPGLTVPPPIAIVLAVAPATAAVAVVARAAGRERLVSGLMVVMLASFAVTGGWIGFGPGEQRCTAATTGVRTRLRSAECRLVFGGGALITAGLTVLAARLWWAGRRGAAERTNA